MRNRAHGDHLMLVVSRYLGAFLPPQKLPQSTVTWQQLQVVEKCKDLQKRAADSEAELSAAVTAREEAQAIRSRCSQLQVCLPVARLSWCTHINGCDRHLRLWW